MRKIFIIGTIVGGLLNGCAGPNPNPGERTADFYTYSTSAKNCDRAIQIIVPKADAGQPWAELRLAYAYLEGCGVKKDTAKALDWFKKVASNTGEGGWANGRMIGAVGKPGYFNQNSDALIAQYHISEIYFAGEGIKKDVIQAYHYAKNVSDKSKGKSVFFCCEWSKEGGLWLSPKMISDNLKKIEQSLTPQQRKEADDLYVSWKP